MTKPLPRPARHLQAFVVSLLVLVVALAILLFGVTMEDTASGTGVIASGRTAELRTPVGGRVVLRPTTLAGGAALADGDVIAEVLMAGDRGEKHTLAPSAVQANGAAEAGRRWQVLEIPVHSGQRVAEGDVVARLVEIDPAEPERLLEPMVRLSVDEKQFGWVARGQEVRLYSIMYPHRIRGVARGRVERIEPEGQPGPSSNRVFYAWVTITESPFPLRLGASLRAEILLGRKPTYQIILEH